MKIYVFSNLSKLVNFQYYTSKVKTEVGSCASAVGVFNHSIQFLKIIGISSYHYKTKTTSY